MGGRYLIGMGWDWGGVTVGSCMPGKGGFGTTQDLDFLRQSTQLPDFRPSAPSKM